MPIMLYMLYLNLTKAAKATQTELLAMIFPTYRSVLSLAFSVLLGRSLCKKHCYMQGRPVISNEEIITELYRRNCSGSEVSEIVRWLVRGDKRITYQSLDSVSHVNH